MNNDETHPAFETCRTERNCTKHEYLSDCPIAHIEGSRRYCAEWEPGKPPKPGKIIKWKVRGGGFE